MTQRRSIIERIAADNALLAMFSCFVGVLLLVALAPNLLVADSWLTLVAGREIADHGLPSVDRLTVIANGAEWVDQQWLAQLLFYWLERAGSLSLVSVVNITLVLCAFVGGIAAARARGASERWTLVVSALVLFAAPWSWQVRAQTFALPLFVAVLWLLVDGSRRPRRRTLVVFPLLVVWANVHGSVVLGALLAMTYGAIELGVHRRLAALVFVALPPLCVLASPYALDLPGYYRLMLVDAPFADVIREWQPSRPGGSTAVFFVLALVAAAAVARHPRRLLPFEVVTLGVTFSGAVVAIRGIAWFALAALVILPYALDGVLSLHRTRPLDPRVNRIAVSMSAAVLAGAALVTLVRPSSWLETSWPEEMTAAVAGAAADPEVRVYPSDRHADWLLWKLPELRGRIAYDVRFELYTEQQLDRIVTYDCECGDSWKRAADGYRVVVVDERSEPSHTADFASEPGSRVVYRDERRAVVVRQVAGRP
jgi:hypothetical protein